MMLVNWAMLVAAVSALRLVVSPSWIMTREKPATSSVAEVQPGKVVYELDGVNETMAREAFALAAAKLPLKTTFVVRQIGQ